MFDAATYAAAKAYTDSKIGGDVPYYSSIEYPIEGIDFEYKAPSFIMEACAGGKPFKMLALLPNLYEPIGLDSGSFAILQDGVVASCAVVLNGETYLFTLVGSAVLDSWSTALKVL